MENEKKMQQLEDRISSSLYEDQIRKVFLDRLKHRDTRDEVLRIMEEYTNTVPFADKVRKFAGEEIDNRVFRSVKFWFTTVISAFIAALIGFFVGR